MIDEQSTEETPTFETWQQLDDAIKANGGVLRLPMIVIRDLGGSQRLKVRVVAGLQQELANMGIGHLPAELPNSQHQWVVLYKVGSPAGAVVTAVRTGNSTKATEKALRDLNTSREATEKRRYQEKLKELGMLVAQSEATLLRMSETIKED